MLTKTPGIGGLLICAEPGERGMTGRRQVCGDTNQQRLSGQTRQANQTAEADPEGA